MDAPRSFRPARVRNSALVLFAVLACALAFSHTGCSHNPATSTTPDVGAAQRVREYFAGDGARWVQSLTVEDIQVGDESRGRTLSLKFVSDGSIQGSDSLTGLYYESNSDHGWTAELNKIGLRLAWVRMGFDFHDGTSSEILEVDIAGHAIAGSTRIRPGPLTTAR